MKKYNFLYGRLAITFSFIALTLLFILFMNILPEMKNLMMVLLVIFGMIAFTFIVISSIYSKSFFESIEKSLLEMIEAVKTGNSIKITNPTLEKLTNYINELIITNKELSEEVEQLRKENYELKDYLTLISKGEIQSSSIVSAKETLKIVMKVESKLTRIFRNMFSLLLRLAKSTYENNKIIYFLEKELSEVKTANTKLIESINDLSKLFVVLSQKLNEFLNISMESYNSFNKFFEISENLSSISRDFYKTSNETEKINQDMFKEINEVINSTKVISEISEQTLILAMNALIEASKIGEEGKGFIVIADEIRRLSESITKFSKSVINNMQSIKGKSNNISILFEKIIEEANTIEKYSKEIEEISSKTKVDFNRIIDSTEILSSNINEISYKIYDSTEKMKLIPKMIDNISDTMIKSMETNNTEINEVLDFIRNSLSQDINIKGVKTLLSLAIADHVVFVNKIRNFITHNIPLNEDEVIDHTKCRLGRWYYSEGIAKFGNIPEFKSIEKPHEKLHKLSSEILKAKEENPERLDELFLQLIKTSSTIVEGLYKIFDNLSTEEDSE